MLLGGNGQGKTNLLEAIYVLTTLKPLRAVRLAELVRFGAAKGLVGGRLRRAGRVRRVAVEVAPGGRTAFLDGKPQDRLDGYFEGLAAVCFSPDDLLLVKAGPDGRRRFLDRAAFNRWPAVLGEAREYVRALRARNAALRAGGAEVEASFRGPLVRTGARLLRRRRDMVAELAPRLGRPSPRSPGRARRRPGRLPASGRLSRGRGGGGAGRRLRALLEARLARDRSAATRPAARTRTTSSGSTAGRQAYGSQGQQRAFALALKIAEMENLRSAAGGAAAPARRRLQRARSGEEPLPARLPRGLPAQAFLTSTDRRLIEPPRVRRRLLQGGRGAVSAAVS